MHINRKRNLRYVNSYWIGLRWFRVDGYRVCCCFAVLCCVLCLQIILSVLLQDFFSMLVNMCVPMVYLSPSRNVTCTS